MHRNFGLCRGNFFPPTGVNLHRLFQLSCSVFFLSDDGPESSFLGTKKPHNRLILCGLVFFGLLLAGICPTRHVELEGFEPSSKRGTNELSTCVVSSWFSCCGRPETTNRGLILLIFGSPPRLRTSYFRFTCTASSISLGKRTIGRCLVAATVAAIKRNLLFFD